MVAAALAVILGLGAVTYAVQLGEEQVADLDENAGRAAQSGYIAAVGATGLAIGALLLLVAGFTYLVSTIRARRAGIARDPAPRAISSISLAAIVLVVAYALTSPTGPVLTALGVASGGGGPSNAVQLVEYEGELTAASVVGQTNAEGIHVFRPVAAHGEIALRMLYETANGNAAAYAVLEAPDGSGWREIARTQPTTDSKVSVPAATYDGDLRVRVRLADGTAGSLGYAVFVSFDPE